MTDALDPIVMNFLYATLGGLMTLGFMWLGCNMFKVFYQLGLTSRKIIRRSKHDSISPCCSRFFCYIHRLDKCSVGNANKYRYATIDLLANKID